MKRFLLLLGAVAMLVAAPAFAQRVFLDLNNDGVCSGGPLDQLGPGTTSVDIWFSTTTSYDVDGTTIIPASCPAGGLIDMTSYAVVLATSGSGSVVFGAYTNSISSFTTEVIAPGSAGSEFWAGYGSTAAIAAGTYKVGSVAVTVTGSPRLDFAPSAGGNPNAFTLFGSNCGAPINGASWLLGDDFTGHCATSAPTPTRSTTWGAIKNLYK